MIATLLLTAPATVANLLPATARQSIHLSNATRY